MATLAPTQQAVYEYPILLKTTVSQFKVDSTSQYVNILFDEGAQRSFITKQLASDIGASPIATENISVAAFGAKKHANRKLDITTINVVDDKGNNIPLQVIIVPTIATPLQFQHSCNIGNLPHLQGLKLTYRVKDSTFNIYLLIRADSYWDIVQDKIIREEMGAYGHAV